MKTNDKKTANKKEAEKSEKNSSKDNVASKNPAHKGPKDKSGKEENKELPDTKAIELDKDIRNDIFKTEVNPHAVKRSPLQNENHAIDPEEVNEDQRIVNQQDDDEGKNKYNSL